ncbi:MAG: GtrA family protein, partial [Myxococcota bacterium]
SGVLVNVALFWTGTELLFTQLATSPRIIASSSFAICLSILSNFILNDLWTWRDRREPGVRAFMERMIKYGLVASAAGLVQLIIAWVLAVPLELNQHVLGVLALLGEDVYATITAIIGNLPGEHLANLIGIVAGAAVNFVVNNAWTFKPKITTEADESSSEEPDLAHLPPTTTHPTTPNPPHRDTNARNASVSLPP